MNRARWARWVYWIPALVWATTIFVLSAQPWLPGPPGGLTDKHGHAFVYGVLAVACLYGLVRGEWSRVTVTHVVTAAGLSVLYGVSDEWHQAFVPGRSPDPVDVLADFVGALTAVGLAWAWAILLRRRDRGRAPHRADGTGARRAQP